MDALRKKHEAKIKTLEDRLRKAEMVADRKQADADARKREAMISAGETVIGVLLDGRAPERIGSCEQIGRAVRRDECTEAEENARALEMNSGAKDEFEKESAAITAFWENVVKERERFGETRRPIRSSRSSCILTLAITLMRPGRLIAG